MNKNNLKLEDIFEMMFDYQKKLGIDFNQLSATEKIKILKEYIIALNCEISELLELVPWKVWKRYSPSDYPDINIEIKEKLFFEWVDCLFFLIDIALAIGIDGKAAAQLFLDKYKENIDRINRKYSVTNSVDVLNEAS